MTKTIIQHFEYKGNKFVIVQQGEWYMAINKKLIDANGVLTQTVYGGYRSIDELIKTEKMKIDYRELLDQGVDEMQALRQVVGM
jgi:hypothetical protein